MADSRAKASGSSGSGAAPHTRLGGLGRHASVQLALRTRGVADKSAQCEARQTGSDADPNGLQYVLDAKSAAIIVFCAHGEAYFGTARNFSYFALHVNRQSTRMRRLLLLVLPTFSPGAVVVANRLPSAGPSSTRVTPTIPDRWTPLSLQTFQPDGWSHTFLMRWRASPGGKGGPRVAKSWDISPDGITYTFHLHSGV